MSQHRSLLLCVTSPFPNTDSFLTLTQDAAPVYKLVPLAFTAMVSETRFRNRLFTAVVSLKIRQSVRPSNVQRSQCRTSSTSRAPYTNFKTAPDNEPRSFTSAFHYCYLQARYASEVRVGNVCRDTQNDGSTKHRLGYVRKFSPRFGFVTCTWSRISGEGQRSRKLAWLGLTDGATFLFFFIYK